jgi:hypothetical protein
VPLQALVRTLHASPHQQIELSRRHLLFEKKKPLFVTFAKGFIARDVFARA